MPVEPEALGQTLAESSAWRWAGMQCPCDGDVEVPNLDPKMDLEVLEMDSEHRWILNSVGKVVK